MNTPATPSTKRLHPSARHQISNALVEHFIPRLDDEELEMLNNRATDVEDARRALDNAQAKLKEAVFIAINS